MNDREVQPTYSYLMMVCSCGMKTSRRFEKLTMTVTTLVGPPGQNMGKMGIPVEGDSKRSVNGILRHIDSNRLPI